jgi:hypothetical protein
VISATGVQLDEFRLRAGDIRANPNEMIRREFGDATVRI